MWLSANRNAVEVIKESSGPYRLYILTLMELIRKIRPKVEDVGDVLWPKNWTLRLCWMNNRLFERNQPSILWAIWPMFFLSQWINTEASFDYCEHSHRLEIHRHPVPKKRMWYTMCPDDTATAGSWAGIGLVNWDWHLLRYWRDI
jgi:hypothetical protein